MRNEDFRGLRSNGSLWRVPDQGVRSAVHPLAAVRAMPGLRPNLMGWPPPTALMCQSGVVENHLRELPVSQVTTIVLDIAKNVFHVHGADERGGMVFSRKII